MAKGEPTLDYREPEWVAKKLGLDKNTVYKYLQEGWLPGVQLGRKWLISERLLAEHLEQATRSQTENRRKNVSHTPRLEQVLNGAIDYAVGRRLSFLGTEHLLIAIAENPECVGAHILKTLGIDPAKPRQLYEAEYPAGERADKTRPPLTPLLEEALRHAREHAIGMGHTYVGSEHALMGLLLVGDGVAFKILQSLGVTFENVRAEVLKVIRA